MSIDALYRSSGRLVAVSGLCMLAACTTRPLPPTPLATYTFESLPPKAERSLRIAVLQGTTVLLRVRQEHAEVRIDYQLPGSSQATTVASPLRREGDEVVILEPVTSGEAKIRIVTSASSPARGSTNVTVEMLRRSSATDRRLADAYRSLSRAAVLSAEGDGSSWGSQAALLQHAAGRFASVQMPRERGLALLTLGYLHLASTSDWRAAIAALDDASITFAASGEWALHAQAEVLAGSVLGELAMTFAPSHPRHARLLASAERRITRGMQTHQRLERAFDRAIAANYLGVLHYYASRPARADEYYGLARAEFARLQERPSEAIVLQNLALLTSERGEYRRSDEAYTALLRRMDASEQPHEYADALQNSAIARLQLGDIDEALRRNERCRQILSRLGDTSGEARALHGMGLALAHAGDHDRSLPLLEAALERRRTLGNKRQLLASLRSVGAARREEGEYEAAVRLHTEGLSLVGSASEEVAVRIDLAADLERMGLAREALIAIQAAPASELPPTHPRRAVAAMTTGYLQVVTSDDTPAGLRTLQTAVDALEGLHSQPHLANALSKLAEAQLLTGDLESAAATAQRALSAARIARLGVASAALRARIAALERSALETRVEALMRSSELAMRKQRHSQSQLQAEAALLTVENARALLLDDLRLEHLQRRWSIEHDRAHASQLLSEQISGKVFRAQQLLERSELPLQEYRQLQQEISLMQAQLDLSLPASASTAAETNSVVASSDGKFSASLPAHSAAIAYFIGERSSWAWLVSPETVSAVRLAPRSSITDAAERLRRSLQAVSSEPTASWHADARSLSSLILWPLRLSTTAAHLRIVPDDTLYDVPFGLLSGSEPSGQLIDTAEIVLAGTLDGSATRVPQGERSNRMLVVADPIFTTLPPLSGTRAEAEAIGSIVDRGDLTLLRGHGATAAGVMELDLSRFAFIHFATHARIDVRDARQSGLALSGVAENGSAVESWIRVPDVLSMKLRADTVVLSGCDTARGEAIAGQGVISLGQSFMAAGSRSVIASQWPLADASAPALMHELYRQLWNAQRPSAALRAAQLKVRASTRWQHPFYWAGLAVYSNERLDH